MVHFGRVMHLGPIFNEIGLNKYAQIAKDFTAIRVTQQFLPNFVKVLFPISIDKKTKVIQIFCSKIKILSKADFINKEIVEIAANDVYFNLILI